MSNCIKVEFKQITQNSILMAKITLEYMHMDYLSIHINCKYKSQVLLASMPFIYEPKSKVFFYRCVIPHNCPPSINILHFKIEYKLYITEFNGLESIKHSFPFTVYNITDKYKYNIFINADMCRVDTDLDSNETAISKIVDFIRNLKLANDTKIIKNYPELLKYRIHKLKEYNTYFYEILDKYKEKGDIFYYLKKRKVFKNFKIESEIKLEGNTVIKIVYDRFVKNKFHLEINYLKEISQTTIYLVKVYDGIEFSTKLVSFDSRFLIYKKFSFKNIWDEFCIKTLFFTIDMLVKIVVDKQCFFIRPTFLQSTRYKK